MPRGAENQPRAVHMQMAPGNEFKSSSNVLIFIQFLKEYDYVKYCQIAFCMFLLLMTNYKKDCSLENKYFNVFCRGKCVKVLLVRNVGERQK